VGNTNFDLSVKGNESELERYLQLGEILFLEKTLPEVASFMVNILYNQ